MKDRHATEVIIISDWSKGDKICHVQSQREIVQTMGKRFAVPIATFFFSGWNPFPCHSMQSTFGVVAKWLYANGWRPNGNSSVKTFYETIDTETGEVLLLDTEKVVTVTKSERSGK